jgi:L-amino acid N-acyltransferase YncA
MHSKTITESDLNVRLASDDDFESIFSIWFEGLDKSFDVVEQDRSSLKEKLLLNFSQRKEIFNFWVAVDNADQIIGFEVV